MGPKELIESAQKAHAAKYGSFAKYGAPLGPHDLMPQHFAVSATQLVELVEYVRIKTEADLINKGWRLG